MRKEIECLYVVSIARLTTLAACKDPPDIILYRMFCNQVVKDCNFVIFSPGIPVDPSH